MNKLHTLVMTCFFSCAALRADDLLIQDKKDESKRASIIKYALIGTGLTTGSYVLFKVYKMWLQGALGNTIGLKKVEHYQHPEWEFKDGKYFIKMVDPVTLTVTVTPLDKPMIFYSHQEDKKPNHFDSFDPRWFKLSMNISGRSIDMGDLHHALLHMKPDLGFIIVSVPEWNNEQLYFQYISPMGTDITPLDVCSLSRGFNAFHKACSEGKKGVLVLMPHTYFPKEVVFDK